MSEKYTDLQANPEFDLEDFMYFSKETRMDSGTVRQLAGLWEKWEGLLKTVQIHGEGSSWLCVWLPSAVEEEIDEAWREQPAKGFLMNSLAQYLCMGAVQELLPQTALSGCSPTPKPHPALRQGLIDLGAGNEDGTLKSRYAVVSYYPFQGGCEVCGLSENCPKNTDHDSTAIVLPGHEK